MSHNVHPMFIEVLRGTRLKPAELLVKSQDYTTKSTFPRVNNPSKWYMLKDLFRLAADHDFVDLNLKLLIDDSLKKNLPNEEFSAIFPPA